MEGEAPSAAVSDADGGCGASGDSNNVTSPPPVQEGESPHPPTPRLRLKAGLATDPALRITDPGAVLTSALPSTAAGLEYLAALNPAFHSGETTGEYALAVAHILGEIVSNKRKSRSSGWHPCCISGRFQVCYLCTLSYQVVLHQHAKLHGLINASRK